MSYKFITNRNSPNYTPGSMSRATFGQPRTYKAIAIHWWGDPKNNPQFGDIVNFLCSPSAGVSAHFVATGTKRQVAQILNFDAVSWATNSANPYTISIECDPRCRPEDYDVVAEVIAQIRDAFGDLPLVPHNKYVATACPGNYDLGKLDKLAKTKDGSGKWGVVKNKNQPKPKPPVKPKPPKLDKLYRLFVDKKQKAAYSSEKNAYSGYVYFGSKGSITYQNKDVTKTIIDKYKPTPKPEVPPKPVEKPSDSSFTESDRTILLSIQKALDWLVERFKSIFK